MYFGSADTILLSILFTCVLAYKIHLRSNSVCYIEFYSKINKKACK